MSRLNNLSLSACLPRRSAPALWSPSWTSSEPVLTGPCLSCTKSSRALHGGFDERLLFRCSQGCSWPSGLRVHTFGSCPVFYPPEYPSHSPQGCFQSLLPRAFIDTGGCPDPGAGPCTWPCWTSWHSYEVLILMLKLELCGNFPHCYAERLHCKFLFAYCPWRTLNEYCVKCNLKICSKELKILLKKFFSNMMLIESARGKQSKQFSLSTV